MSIFCRQWIVTIATCIWCIGVYPQTLWCSSSRVSSGLCCRIMLIKFFLYVVWHRLWWYIIYESWELSLPKLFGSVSFIFLR